MGSWSKGFMAGCATVLAAVMLVSVFMLPSIGDIVDGVHGFGTSIVSSVLPTGGGGNNSNTAPPSGSIEFLNLENIGNNVGNSMGNSSPFGGGGFDDW